MGIKEIQVILLAVLRKPMSQTKILSRHMKAAQQRMILTLDCEPLKLILRPLRNYPKINC